MDRRTRFGWWAGLVAVALLAPVVAAILAGRLALPAGAEPLARVVALSGVLWLLATTPADAIKLPRSAGVWIVGLGAGLVSFFDSAPVAAALFALLAGLAAWAVGVGALGRRSPWWVAPFAWHPALLGVMDRENVGALGLFALLGAFVSVTLSGARGVGVRPLAWALWVLACGLSVVAERS